MFRHHLFGWLHHWSMRGDC